MNGIAKKVAFGAAWMVALRMSVRLIGLVSTLILVRLLVPADFGIVAMAMSIVASVELLTAFGFEVALIQNQQADDDDYNTAWTMNVLLGLGASVLLLVLAKPATTFYNNEDLYHVFLVLSLASVLQGLQNIGLVEFRKELQFNKEFAFFVSLKIASFIITISLAFWLRSYWALIIGIVAGRAFGTVLSYVIHPYRPRWSFAALHRIMNFSKWLFLNNLMQILRFRGPDFIIGRLANASGLGVFSISREISNLPTTELVAPVNRALLPGFSKIADDKEKARQGFVRVASLLAIMSLPVGLGIAVTSHLMTPIVLGEKWLEAIPMIRILAVFGAIMAIQSPITTVLIAIGKPRFVSYLSMVNASVMLPLLYTMTARHGITGSAWALLGAATFFLPIYYLVSGITLQMRPGDVAAIFLRPILGAATMYLTVDSVFGSAAATVPNLVGAVALGAGVYVGVVGLLWFIAGRPETSAEGDVLRALRGAIARRLGSG